MKTKARILAEQVQALTGDTLIQIHCEAMQFVDMGLCQNLEAALQYMIELQETK